MKFLAGLLLSILLSLAWSALLVYVFEVGDLGARRALVCLGAVLVSGWVWRLFYDD